MKTSFSHLWSNINSHLHFRMYR